MKKLKQPPRTLDARAAKRELRKYPIDTTLDLHGMSRPQAHEAVMRLLSRARAHGWRHLLVITGKGAGEEGVLRRALPLWLEERGESVMALAPAAREKGGSGALHVLLRRPR